MHDAARINVNFQHFVIPLPLDTVTSKKAVKKKIFLNQTCDWLTDSDKPFWQLQPRTAKCQQHKNPPLRLPSPLLVLRMQRNLWYDLIRVVKLDLSWLSLSLWAWDYTCCGRIGTFKMICYGSEAVCWWDLSFWKQPPRIKRKKSLSELPHLVYRLSTRGTIITKHLHPKPLMIWIIIFQNWSNPNSNSHLQSTNHSCLDKWFKIVSW